MKIRHCAIVDNVVVYVYAKFDDDWLLWNEKALADCEYDNNNNPNPKNNNNNNVGVAWRPVSGSAVRIVFFSFRMNQIVIVGLKSHQ